MIKCIKFLFSMITVKQNAHTGLEITGFFDTRHSPLEDMDMLYFVIDRTYSQTCIITSMYDCRMTNNNNNNNQFKIKLEDFL